MTEGTQKKIIALVKGALTDECVNLPDKIDLPRLYKFATRQNVISLLYYGLVNCGFDAQGADVEQFFVSTCQYLVMSEQQDDHIQVLFKEFEDNQIDYLPLKGILLRKLYPRPEMRAMGDADVLIKVEQYDKIKPIMQSLGYTEGVESDHELVWHKDSVVVELHKRLIPSYNKDYYKYFGDGWSKAEKCSDSTRYQMSAEDNFIYLLTHFAKHYRDGGIGIKHLVDIKLYLDKYSLDFDYLKEQFEALKLWEFFNNVRKTVAVWFDGAEEDEITRAITDKILLGGAFGTNEAHSTSAALKRRKQGQKNIRTSRFFASVFPPYKNMCLLFPSLKKVPFLLPFYWIWRVIYTAFNKKRVLTKHYNAIKDMSPEKITQYEKELNTVGLDYRFEEDD